MKFFQPLWIKTTVASWSSTATGIGFASLAELKDEIQAWAALIGGILIPIIALSLHFYKVFKK